MADEKTILELISQVDEFLEMHEFFDDTDFDLALSKIVRIIADPSINPASALTGLIQLQGLSSKFYMQASYMKNVSKPKPGTKEYQKKNMFYAMAQTLDQLVAALKYAVK